MVIILISIGSNNLTCSFIVLRKRYCALIRRSSLHRVFFRLHKAVIFVDIQVLE